MPWGYHLIVDLQNCDHEAITSGEHIAKFSKDLVEKIDMKAYGEPQVVHFAEHDLEKSGFTLVQLIETSNICAHFCDNTNDAYFDVFSCKQFDIDVALDTIHNWFKPEKSTHQYVLRGEHNS